MNINLTLIMQAVAFAIFIWLCAIYVWPYFEGKIAERQKTIADGLAAGEQGRENLASAEHRVSELVAEARAKACLLYTSPSPRDS